MRSEFIFLLTRVDLLTEVNKSTAHFHLFVKSFCNIFSKKQTGFIAELGSFLNLMVLPFEGHPYKVLDNDEMNNLIDSIQQKGVISPIVVRPLENTDDEYEIISGHRRLRASVKAGLEMNKSSKNGQ